jgi:DNA-binding HxlR family transcriptional regulator
MAPSPHRIRRLQWRVSTPAIDQAFLLRQRLCNQWQDELLPVIEAAFDQVGSSNRIFHISKLDIHLSVTSLEDLNDRLPDLLQQQLKAQLQSLEQQSLESDQAQSTSPQQSSLTALLHYLRTGSLPWQTTHQAPIDITIQLQETCQQQRSLLLSQLQSASDSVACYFRLLQLIPPGQWHEFVMACSDHLPTSIRSVAIQILVRLSQEASDLTRYSQLNLAAVILSESLKLPAIGPTTGSLNHLLTAIAHHLSAADQSVLDKIISALPDGVIPSTPPLPHSNPTQSESNSSPLDEEPKTRNRLIFPATDTPISSVVFPEHEELEVNRSSAIKNSVMTNSVMANSVMANSVNTAIVLTTDFPLSIRCAGLLLAGPFLTRLLEMTGVKDPQQREIPAAQLPRTAALLHYLATGEDTPFEHELTLIKVLLGLTPDQPLLVAEGLLQPDDKAETEVLLQSLIDYWGALKTTSIDGLRSSFLQRSGLLRDRDNGWWVQVEPKPYDMLLNQLPWSISVVKLPWMQRPIYSEWPIP